MTEANKQQADQAKTAPDQSALIAELMARVEAAEKVAAEAKAASGKGEPKPKKAPPLTKANQYKATARGHALGELIEEGQLVPAGVPVSDLWMEKVDKKEAAVTRGLEEALDQNDADVNLSELKGDALTAYAAGLHINRGDMSDKDLRAVIAAKRADTA